MIKKYSINKVNLILGIYLILLQLYDVYVTMVAINLGGTEFNPIVSFFMDNFGIYGGLVFIKFSVLCSITVIVIKECLFTRQILITLVAFYAIILGYITACHYDILF